MLNSPGHVAVRAAVMISFRALLRKCHVTDSEYSLVRSDLVVHSWGIMVWVRKSKINQFHARIHKISIVEVANRELCSDFWLFWHLEQFPAPAGGGGGKAFRMLRGRYSIQLFYMAVLKAACRTAGMHPNEFSSHSLRSGGAKYLRLCGSSEEEMKEMREWKSDCVKQYLKATVLDRLTDDTRVVMLLGTFQL